MPSTTPSTENSQPTQPSRPSRGSEASASGKDLIAPVLGVIILLGFGLFIWYLMTHLGLSDVEWTRAVFLFGGVEAIAFAAAGYFFGTQVQRGRVEEAKAEARGAEQVASAATETARSERRASTVLATGVLEAADGKAGGLLGEESPFPPALIEQARALLRG